MFLNYLSPNLCLFIYSESNIISIWNNGKGIPVVEHKVEKVYVPALIFGQLLTSSNYDDDEKKVTGKESLNGWLDILLKNTALNIKLLLFLYKILQKRKPV